MVILRADEYRREYENLHLDDEWLRTMPREMRRYILANRGYRRDYVSGFWYRPIFWSSIYRGKKTPPAPQKKRRRPMRQSSTIVGVSLEQIRQLELYGETRSNPPEDDYYGDMDETKWRQQGWRRNKD